MFKYLRVFGAIGLVAAFVIALPTAAGAEPAPTIDACVNQWNGAVRISDHCARSEFPLQWDAAEDGAIEACVSNWTGTLRISEHCSRSETAIAWNANPWGNVTACVNTWNGATRIASNCSRSEHPVTFQSIDFSNSPQCDPSYTNVCLPSAPDLNCADLLGWMKPVTIDYSHEDADPHHLDGNHDGIACTS